jgi:hypothetical protein
MQPVEGALSNGAACSSGLSIPVQVCVDLWVGVPMGWWEA